MHFTARLKETDPHDVPAIAPDVVPSTWADRVLADITRDAKSIQPDHPSRTPAPAPAVDTSFRAAAVARPSRAKWIASATMAFLFALGSAFAAAGWQHYGDSAKELIAEWTPQFALASSPPAVPVDQAATPADQAAAVDQAAPSAVVAAQPAESTSPTVVAAVPSEPAELIQSMARDLAAMGQQIEQLKASIAELRANQQPAMARTSEAKPTEAKPADIKPLAPAPVARPKVSAVAPPPRPAPPPVRRPPPVQASTAPIQLAAPPPPPPAAPPAQATARPDEEPVVRPPMPLRWGGVND
jgi:hypothetical protein